MGEVAVLAPTTAVNRAGSDRDVCDPGRRRRHSANDTRLEVSANLRVKDGGRIAVPPGEGILAISTWTTDSGSPSTLRSDFDGAVLQPACAPVRKNLIPG